jgi:outer membrane immunogenic protein
MKKLALTVSILALGSASAFGADLPAKVYTKAPPPVVAVYDWTGFYLGGNVGYSWGRSSTTTALTDPLGVPPLLAATSAKFDLNGVIGGGQIGYNWQRSNWVFGLEGDIQGSDEKGSTNSVCPGGSPTATTLLGLSGPCTVGHLGDTAPFNVAAFPVTSALSEKIEWFGTVRGRIGPTITPTILAYVTGGLAYGEVKATETIAGTNVTNPGGQGVNGGTVLTPFTASFGNSSTRVGWTVGAGVEGAISGNWTAKIEYLYMDLGNISGSFITPVIAPSGGFVTASYNTHITDNILRVGVNYRWGGPVVAKY